MGFWGVVFLSFVTLAFGHPCAKDLASYFENPSESLENLRFRQRDILAVGELLGDGSHGAVFAVRTTRGEFALKVQFRRIGNDIQEDKSQFAIPEYSVASTFIQRYLSKYEFVPKLVGIVDRNDIEFLLRRFPQLDQFSRTVTHGLLMERIPNPQNVKDHGMPIFSRDKRPDLFLQAANIDSILKKERIVPADLDVLFKGQNIIVHDYEAFRWISPEGKEHSFEFFGEPSHSECFLKNPLDYVTYIGKVLTAQDLRLANGICVQDVRFSPTYTPQNTVDVEAEEIAIVNFPSRHLDPLSRAHVGMKAAIHDFKSAGIPIYMTVHKDATRIQAEAEQYYISQDWADYIIRTETGAFQAHVPNLKKVYLLGSEQACQKTKESLSVLGDIEFIFVKDAVYGSPTKTD